MIRPVGILLVDDEKDFAVGLARLLGRKYPDERIKAVHSGTDALSELEREHYGLMLTDLNMPGMDGVELLGKAKQPTLI